MYFNCLNRAQKDGIHKEFQRTIDAGVCNYNRELDALIVISKWEHTQKRASMLKDMHFRNLSQKVNIACFYIFKYKKYSFFYRLCS